MSASREDQSEGFVMRLRILVTFVVASLGLWQTYARADEPWPTHTVRVVVGQPGGGATDIVARVFADAFSKTFKQTFVIDNKPGANGIIATDFAKHAPADGYTLLFTYAAAQVVNQSLYKDARYDGAKDFEAIAQVGAEGNFLIANSNVPANDLQEFIAYVKSKPANSLSYGSWGIGSGGHLSMEVINQKAGIDLTHVPYKSSTAAVQAVLSGEVPVAFASALAALPLVQAGQIKALAISAPRRSTLLPNVKTMAEQNVPFDLTAWYGIFAPKGTPRAIVDALNAEANRLIKAPEMQEKWKTLGFSYMPTKTPGEFAATVQNDIIEWGKIAKASHISAD